ncbi:MAG: hypothetical protein LUG99_19890 [Lachnospiraceae bacterium]|nr:hypothetical protein [Lachnospiraceae bacterium]
MNRFIYRILSSQTGARIQIRILLRQTARTFGVNAPRTTGMSASELLRTYAQFTADESRRAMDSGQDLVQLHQKLYDMAYHLGSRLRRWMRPHDDQDCLAILALLYQNIEILISERNPGEFYVRKCYFSAFYTPEVCSLISGIDQGIFAGIYQRGRLTFEDRITEGYNQCKACLK